MHCRTVDEREKSGSTGAREQAHPGRQQLPGSTPTRRPPAPAGAPQCTSQAVQTCTGSTTVTAAPLAGLSGRFSNNDCWLGGVCFKVRGHGATRAATLSLTGSGGRADNAPRVNSIAPRRPDPPENVPQMKLSSSLRRQPSPGAVSASTNNQRAC